MLKLCLFSSKNAVLDPPEKFRVPPAALFNINAGVVHEGIIKAVNKGRWFVLPVWDKMRWQHRVLINFSFCTDGRQKSWINHGGQEQSAPLLAPTEPCFDKPRCSIIKLCNQDSSTDICFTWFWVVITFVCLWCCLRFAPPKLNTMHSASDLFGIFSFFTCPSYFRCHIHEVIKSFVVCVAKTFLLALLSFRD